MERRCVGAHLSGSWSEWSERTQPKQINEWSRTSIVYGALSAPRHPHESTHSKCLILETSKCSFFCSIQEKVSAEKRYKASFVFINLLSEHKTDAYVKSEATLYSIELIWRRKKIEEWRNKRGKEQNERKSKEQKRRRRRRRIEWKIDRATGPSDLSAHTRTLIVGDWLNSQKTCVLSSIQSNGLKY